MYVCVCVCVATPRFIVDLAPTLWRHTIRVKGVTVYMHAIYTHMHSHTQHTHTSTCMYDAKVRLTAKICGNIIRILSGALYT